MRFSQGKIIAVKINQRAHHWITSMFQTLLQRGKLCKDICLCGRVEINSGSENSQEHHK